MGGYTRDGIARGRGLRQIGANAARARLDSGEWFRGRKPTMSVGAWGIYTADFMPDDCAFVAGNLRAIAIGVDTWDVISHHQPAQAAFVRVMTNSPVGMVFLPMDEGVYAAAVAKAGGNVREEVDPTGVQMASVAQMAERLVVQAAGVVQVADSRQTSIFLSNHAKIDEELKVIETEVARLRQLVDLARETVLGSLV